MFTTTAAETIAADRRHDRQAEADRSHLVAPADGAHARPWWTLFWAGSPAMPSPRPAPPAATFPEALTSERSTRFV